MNNNFKRTLNFEQDSYGVERRQEWEDSLAQYTGYLPKGIYIKDIDTAMIDMVKNELAPIVKLKKDVGVIESPMPVIFLTSQRWSEITKTFDLTIDEFKDISLPFITVIRNNDIQVGTGQNGYYNIAGRRNWIYLEVPTFESGRKGVDLYKIPQPTSVDISYEVRVFTTKINDQNSASEKIHKSFNALQKYIMVLDHPMPVSLESVNDESELDLEERKLYINNYDLLVKGYILDEKDFEVVSTTNRVATSFELGLSNNHYGKKIKAIGDIILYNFKDKVIIGEIKNNNTYTLGKNMSIFSGSRQEFCNSTEIDYDGC